MFKTRLLSSIVLVILMVTAISAGSTVFAALFLVISLVGMMELYRIFGLDRCILGYVGYALAIGYDVAVYLGNGFWADIILIGGLMAIMAIYVSLFPRFNSSQIMAAYFGLVYVAVMLSFVFRLRMMQDGFYLIWLVFICSWVNDTCAYCVGILMGKHKMAPKLSPKKTIEGAIGGVAGTAAVAALYGHFLLQGKAGLNHPEMACAIACAVAAVLSIIGDLAASAIKRNYDVKDYGNLIPGHGGILDRFDSMIFTAPVIYWAVIIISQL